MKEIFIHPGNSTRTLALALTLALPQLAAAQPEPPAGAALAAFATRAKAQGLSAADVTDVLVTDSYTDDGITHTYVQQRVNGLAVLNATGAVHTDAKGRVLFASQDFVPNGAAAARTAPPTPALTPEQAVGAAATGLGLPRPVALRRTKEARLADGLAFNKAGISESDIPVRLMYARQGDKLVLVWQVRITQLDQQHVWSAYVDAQTGRLVAKTDHVINELTAFRDQGSRRQSQLPQARVLAPAGQRSVQGTAAANSLTVVPVPFENPLLTSRVTVPLAPVGSRYSPLGWQVGQAPAGTFADSYSLLSSGKQLTRGNNVAAYDDFSNALGDLVSPNLSLAASSPDGGSSLSFDFAMDPTKSARDPGNVAAGVTNLFYWNNVLHDIMQAHGFNEISGNFQNKNLTKDAKGNTLGKGSDEVFAESQDGSGRNNANFYPPPDGTNGRMQMYLFSNSDNNKLTIAGPANVAGTYAFAQAKFGPALARAPLAGKLVLVDDGVSDDGGDHACASPFVNSAAVAGNIAFLQRGGCAQLPLTPRVSSEFASKVQKAQANGATGVIMFDSLAGPNLYSFGGIDTVGLRIPAIFISGDNGFKLRAALRAGSTLDVVSTVEAPDVDGSFDNGVVSHEFGHGISNRLTGGPATTDCLDNRTGAQTMGEGWSDFFGLWMTTQPGDVGSTNRYIATYDNTTPIATGPGFRTKAYSTNMSATGNDYTYAQLGPGIRQFSETHDVGEVWCAVLWDLNWQFIYRYGYNTDFYAASGGNNQLLKLVLDGCKLQVCQPGFLDGRDAILRADSINSRAANADLIWNVFARRGMGYGAKQGDRVNGIPFVNNIVEAFDLPPNVRPLVLATRNGATSSSTLEVYPNPAQDRLTVRTQLSGATSARVELLNLLGQVVVPGLLAPAAQLQQSGIELNTSSLAAGLYVVRVTTATGTFTSKVTIQH